MIDNDIRANGMRCLLEHFRNDHFFFSQLRVLDLTNNNIREEGIMYLSLLIHNNLCPNLEELSLISGFVSKGMAYLRYR